MDYKQLILLNHPTQVRIILESRIQIAPAIFPNEGVFRMGGYITNQGYQVLTDEEAEEIRRANPYELVSLVTGPHAHFKNHVP